MVHKLAGLMCWQVDDIMAKLKGMPGMENIKVYGRDDIEKMAKQFGNKGDL